MKVLKGKIVACTCGRSLEYEDGDIVPAVECPECGELLKVKDSLPSIGLGAIDKKGWDAMCVFPIAVISLDDISWDEVCKIPTHSLALGATKTITLKNGEKYAVQVTDRRNGLMLSFKDLYGHEDGGGMAMNSEEDYKRNYEDCDIRKWLNGEFFNLLPDDLVKHLAPAEIVSNGKTLKDKVFIPSEMEVFGKDEYGNCKEGEQLELYADWHNRISGYADGQYSRWWWLRTKHKASSHWFCGVCSYGGAGYSSAGSSGGVRPHFLIK